MTNLILNGHLVRLKYTTAGFVKASWQGPIRLGQSRTFPIWRKLQRDGTRERPDFIKWAASSYVDWMNKELVQPAASYRLKLHGISVGIYSEDEDVLILHTVEEPVAAPAEILVTG